MIFNEHSKFVGLHAFLSASKYHWINYDEDKIERAYTAAMAARRGTELHAFAHEAIRLGVKLPKTPLAINLYVNDAIGYRMTPEQVLFYSENCFGTADTISFRKNLLRIHDLKTGTTRTSVKQLEIYAALFCLEYKYKPFDITIELRIYQSNEARIYEVDPHGIMVIMDKIVMFDKRITEMRLEAEA
jgi:hypothetical protein